MATGWSQAQVDYLKKHDPKKLAGGYKSHYKGQGTLQGGQSATGGGGGQKTLYGRTYASKQGTPAGGNKLQMQPAGKSGGGGLLQGRAGGAQQAFGANQPTMSKGMSRPLIGGALGGLAGFQGAKALGMATLGGSAKAGAITGAFSKGAGALFGAGKMGAIMGGPIGWGIAGGLLGASALGLIGNKSNKQFEGTIQTGGAQGFKGQGGQMAQVSEGYIPTADEFVQHGRWLMPEDSYAHDYGRTFGESDRKYYDNFRSAVENARNPAERKAILAAHGFDSPAKKKEAPKPKRRAAPALVEAAPAPKKPTKESVSKPASGLEDTIKTKPEEIKRTYMRPGRKKKAGFFSYGGEMA